jgi:hypothetical protein
MALLTLLHFNRHQGDMLWSINSGSVILALPEGFLSCW